MLSRRFTSSPNSESPNASAYMNDFLIFGLSVALSLLAWGFICYSYVWPRVKGSRLAEAVRPLIYLNLFRFVGLSFIVPGVAAPSLPHEFAAPGAYGDLIAVVLGWVALGLLNGPAAVPALWVFNIWGAGDLLFAFYKGLFDPQFHPSSLGATFYIPTVLVPLLLCVHFIIFAKLLQRAGGAVPLGQTRG
jgi:hypothetical protein